MKRIIVTGDSKGLGKRIIEKILEDSSYGVVGISRSDKETVEALYRQYGDRFVHVTYDLEDSKGIKSLYKESLSQYGPFYGLVNNSALAYDDLATNMKIDQLEKMFHVNVFSAMHLTKIIIRDMILNKVEGSIVHVSSICGHTGYKGLSMYAASKGALEAYSKNIAREWGSKGIRSNCVVPGFMETSMSASLTEDQKNRIYKRTSLKKETDATSVANTIVFLLSEQSKSITGSLLHVDNGTI